MIRIVDRGKYESGIRFTPSFHYREAPVIECNLHVGYTCPVCNNVIQAVFDASHRIEFVKYEETNVYSIVKDMNEGIRKVVPEFAGDLSNYKFSEYVTKTGFGYTLTLKNHVVNWKGTQDIDREGFFEVGERCCMYSSLISLRSEDVVRERLMGQLLQTSLATCQLKKSYWNS